ncbi:S-adenosyl-L-methionine-dependent methyltransferase [Cladochytrium replicatum]|nr:S-adenosyl-L-methionine-dependent methyltransferase [Cladochytrium replicatum]
MRQCAGHPEFGYYMNGEIFGEKGDFTTSPEISQLFGELVTLWFVSRWQGFDGAGDPTFQFVELGPGRGTLMQDILRTSKMFPIFVGCLRGVHLVETSPSLRKRQAETLGVTADDVSVGTTLKTDDGIEVTWHETLDTVPRGKTSWYIAHELFDALPVHKFQLTNNGWRELLVDIDNDNKNPHHFRFYLSREPTAASLALMPLQSATASDLTNPTSSAYFDRYAKLQVGDTVEVSPDATAIMEALAQRIGGDGGAGLVVDYGKDHLVPASLRAVRKHQFGDILESPGLCDVTADVDFSLLRMAAERHAQPHGPVSQAQFLHRMGIQTRVEMLKKSYPPDSDAVRDLVSGYKRLVDEGEAVGGMGRLYKVLSIVKRKHQVPYGFEEEQPSTLAKSNKSKKVVKNEVD